jgi:site-specific DNA-methyltransferase (adenine-specific)
MMACANTPARLTGCNLRPSLKEMGSRLHSPLNYGTATLRSWLVGAQPVGLFEADARTLLAALPAESVDLVCTDPPYRFHRGGYFDHWFAADLPDDAWPGIFTELHRVLRPDRHAYVFANARLAPRFDAAARAAGFTCRAPLVWDKLSPGLGRTWRAQYEFVCWYEKGRRVGPDRRLGNVLRASRVRRHYPTEKPGEILRTVIGQASLPGEVVLDPFCGSGSAGQATVALGRRALLGDLTPETAAERLDTTPVSLGGPDGR